MFVCAVDVRTGRTMGGSVFALLARYIPEGQKQPEWEKGSRLQATKAAFKGQAEMTVY